MNIGLPQPTDVRKLPGDSQKSPNGPGELFVWHRVPTAPRTIFTEGFRAVKIVALAVALGVCAGHAIAANWSDFNFNSFDESAALITQPPIGQTVASGVTVVLSVGASGTGLQYQWVFNGDLLQGATQSTLTITNVSKNVCGSYQVIVYNGTDADISAEANVLLAASPLPFADTFANRGVISTATGSGCVNVQNATIDPLDPKAERGWLFHTAWMSWTAPASGVVQFDTIGSACDSWLGIYTGTSLTSLTKVASDDDSGGYHSAFVTFNAQAGTTYQIMVATRDVTPGPVLLNWDVHTPITPLPTITVMPADLTVLPGAAGSMCVDFQTTGTVKVQWYRNDQPIAGATQKCLQWTALTVADLGRYEVELSTPDWTWTLRPAEIQFNSEGLASVGARGKLSDSISSSLVGR